MSRFASVSIPLVALALAGGATPLQAQNAWQTDGLTAAIDTQGAPLYTQPGQQPTSQLAPGTTVTLQGVSADGSGLVPVSTPQGAGWINPSNVAAVPATVIPSVVTPGSYVTTGGPNQPNQVITIDITGFVTAILALANALQNGNQPGSLQSGVALLGQGGDGSPSNTADPFGFNAPPAAQGGAPTAGSPAAPATSGAGSINQGIIATAEEAQRGASGRYLARGSLFASLPDKAPMQQRMQVVVQLADAQGQAVGGTITAPVEDVGPWRTDDDYWTTGRRPAAEAMKGLRVAWNRQHQGWWPVTGRNRGRYRCNGSGIDVSSGGWQKLIPGLSRRQADTQQQTVNWWFAGSGGSQTD